MINIKNFRFISILEGVSLLLLYFFAMPMKYFYGDPNFVKHIGLIHGMLFAVYALFTIILFSKNNINIKELFYFILLSIIPFGFYVLEKIFFKQRKF